MDVFDLVAKITLDSDAYERGLSSAGKKISGLGQKLKGGMVAVGKATAAGVAATTAAVGALAKTSLESYSNYEQLVGGVETLFGAGGQSIEEYAKANGKSVSEIRGEYNNLMAAQKEVIANADAAYTNAGMSANEYMETVTGFSASLIQSLGGNTKEAAKVADMAVTDMSDNANKMGTDIESIQNAYQGFAKQNYTMLDNLKLGYGGTKEEMQRLIDDANKLKEANGEMGDLSIESFADVAEAIHLVQDEMGIAGTTANEAATTIEGSVKQMKGAWSNLVTGLASDDADIDTLVDNLVSSVETAAHNIMPRLSKILEGVGTLVEKLAPVIAEELPGLIETLAPSLLTAGSSLLEGLTAGLIQALPTLADSAVELVNSLITFIIENLPLLIDGAVQIIIALAEGIAKSLPELVPTIVDAVILIGQTLIENAPLLLDAAEQIVMGLIEGILMCFPDLGEAVDGIVQFFSDGWADIKEEAEKEWDDVTATVTGATENISSLVSEAWENIKSAASELKEDVVTKFNGLKEDLTTTWEDIKTNVSQKWDDIKSKASETWENIKEAIWKPIEDAKEKVHQAIENMKGFFNFEWSLPKIKLPHFSVSGQFSLNPPSIPTFGIEWYRKAMDNAMLLDGATIFGAAGGKLLGAGEAGPEVVSGAGTLMDMIVQAVRQAASVGNVTININVNAANIQNDQKLAERISEELQYLLDRRAAAVGAV